MGELDSTGLNQVLKIKETKESEVLLPAYMCI